MRVQELLHHLGSSAWKKGERLLGSHPTTPLHRTPHSPLSSPCCKNSPSLRKENTVWSVSQLLSNCYKNPRDFSQWTGTRTSKHVAGDTRSATTLSDISAPGCPLSQHQPVPPSSPFNPASSLCLLIHPKTLRTRQAQQSICVLVTRLFLIATGTATPFSQLPHTYKPWLH